MESCGMNCNNSMRKFNLQYLDLLCFKMPSRCRQFEAIRLYRLYVQVIHWKTPSWHCQLCAL